MATILCSKSGIEFHCDHFPIHLTQRESQHPIFDAPLKRLWKYFPKWQSAELTETDSYLYFIALLDATELVEFRAPCRRTAATASIVQSNMESLYYTIGRIVTIRHPKFSVPRIAISPDTADLSNVRHWIATWAQCYDDFASGLKDQELRSRLERKAVGLERLIKNPSLNPSKYARMLASWCSEAADFPVFDMIDSIGNKVSCSEYWQEIIVKCHTDTNIITIPETDLVELLEHCETNLDAGSIQAHHLFTTIRLGLQTLQGFFSIGKTSFAILSDSDNVESVNMQLLIDSAPVTPPLRTSYATEFQFIKAKMKYQLWLSSNSNANANTTANPKDSNDGI